MNVQAPIRILIVEDDEALVERFSLTAADFPDVQLLGAVNSVPEALDFVRRIPIDFVVLDLELANSHGIQFLNAILNGEVESPPHVIVMTVVTGPATLNDVHAKRVERIFWKGEDSFIQAGPQAVLEYIREIAPFCAAPSPPKPQSGLNETLLRLEVEDELARYGATMGTKTTNYTVDAIIELAKLPQGYVNLKEDIYPKVMARRKAKYKNVVNGIKYCVTAMWDKLPKEGLSEAYTPFVNEAKGMGAQKQVLLFFANRIRTKRARSA